MGICHAATLAALTTGVGYLAWELYRNRPRTRIDLPAGNDAEAAAEARRARHAAQAKLAATIANQPGPARPTGDLPAKPERKNR